MCLRYQEFANEQSLRRFEDTFGRKSSLQRNLLVLTSTFAILRKVALRIYVDQREQDFVEERADALEQPRVFLVACPRAELSVEHCFQNKLAKIDRRARGVPCRKSTSNEHASVLARDAAPFVEIKIALHWLFDERDNAREQFLSELALFRALLFVRLRVQAKPFRRCMRAQFFADVFERVIGRRISVGGFALTLDERLKIERGKAAVSAGSSITWNRALISPFAHRADVDAEQTTGFADRKPIA